MNYTLVAKEINKKEEKGPKLFIAYKLGNPLVKPYDDDIIVYISKTHIQTLPDKFKDYEFVEGWGSSTSSDINYGMSVSNQFTYLIVRKEPKFRFGDWIQSLDIVFGRDP